MNKTRMGKRVASLLLSLVMMLSLLPTAAYAAMGDADETQGASVSENGTRVSDDSNSGGDTGDLQVGDSEGNGDTGDLQVGGSSVSGTADDTTGTEGGADPTDSVNGNDSADPQDNEGAVMPVASSVVSTSAELVAAIAAASDGDTITLGEGDFTTYGNTSPKKSLTFEGAGTETVWTIGDLSKDARSEGNGDCSFDGCGTITFRNMTLKSDGADYRGFIRISNTVVENCTLEGKTAYWGYETAKFEGSTFNAPEGDYALWDYSTKAMSFDNCKFNISGKGVNVYVEAGNAGEATRTVAVNNCTVNSTKENKAFLNIKNSTQAYDVTLSGTNTVTGLANDGTTGSALYQVETTKVTETAGNPVTVKQENTAGELETVYEVKETVAETTMDLDAFIKAVVDSGYNYDGNGVTVKWSPASGCFDTRDGHACTVNNVKATGNTPNRVNAKYAQYQLFSGLTQNVTIKNVKFVYEATEFTVCANSGWAGSGTAANLAEFQFENEGDVKLLDCSFDGVAVAVYNDIETASTVVHGCSFTNITQDGGGYAIHYLKGGKIDVSENTFENVYRGMLVQSTVNKGTNIVNNNFSGIDAANSSCYMVKLLNVKDTDIVISGNTTAANASVNVNVAYDGAAGAAIAVEDRISTIHTAETDGNSVKISAGGDQMTGYTAPSAAVADASGITVDVDGNVTVTLPAKTTYVAAVGEKKFDSLQAAIDAATEKATVILLADTRENVTISTNRLTLDLNGHTLNGGTVAGKPALTVRARNVIVKDSSEAKTGTIMREDTAENSGVSSHYVIDIQGKGAFLTFESGNVKNNSGNKKGNGASLVRVGDDSVSAWPQLTIAGGTFTQDNFIVIKVDRGTFYLTGGTLNSKNDYAVENWYTATIKGGTVNGTVAAWTYSGGHNSDLTISDNGIVNGDVTSVNYGSAEGKVAKVSITGGTVTGTLGTYTYDSNSGNFVATTDAAKATIAVTGGTFSKDPTKYVVEDSAISKNDDGTYGVAKAYLAKVGDTSYYTMDEAFKAQTASGKDIVMLRDYTTGSTFNSGSINRTVDLAGHTWTCTGTDANSAAFEINNANATLTVKNGKVVSSQLVGLIPSAMGGTIKYDNSTLVFDGVEMTTTAHSGIETNGNNTNDTVTLRNSTLNVPNGFGIYFPSSGTLTIDNSKINAQTMGVQVCSGSLNISGAGTAITVSGDGIPKTINDGAIEDGAAISIVNRTGYKGLSEIKVEGGTFTAKGSNVAVKAYDWDNTNKTESDFTQAAKVSVSGGTFSSAVDKSLCADGFIPTENTDGTYGVKEGKYVAEIGSQGYESLQEAINAAQDGQTVTLLADATEDVVINKSITLDLGGKTLTNTNAGKATISVTSGTVTVKNGNVVGGTSYYNIEVTKNSGADLTLTDVTATAGNTGSSMIDNWGTLTITSGTYTGGMNTVKSEEGSVLNISGGTFTCDFGQNYKYTAVILVYGTTTITGGEFIQKTTNTSSHAQVVATGVEEGYSAITTITGGKFTNEKLSGIFHGLGKATSDNFEVSGGTFNKYVSDSYMAEGLIPVKQSDGTYGVKEGKFVAEVGSIGYETFDEAIAAANASANSKTVYLRENITVDHQLVINNVNSKAITLDLQKHTLTSTYAINTAIKNGSYALVNNTPLTIKNGTFAAGQARAIGALERLTLNGATVTQQLTGGHACVAFCADGKSYTIKNSTIEGAYAVCSFANNATINITGSKLTGTGNTLYHNGTNYGLKLTVKDTTITSSGSCGVYISGSTSTQSNAANQNGAGKYQQASFTGCTISGAMNGVEVKYTDLTLDGCTVSTTAKDASYKQDNNGPAGSGFAVVSTDNAMNNVTPKPEGTIIIKGTGKYTGPVGLGSLESVKETYADFADETIKISGGTFSTAVPAAYCADGFIPTQNEDGTYGVKVGKYVAEVGSTKYETLTDAVAAAQDGQTVRLLADVEQNTQLSIDKSITLDLNGKTIKNTEAIWNDDGTSVAILSITNGANVTITGNGTIAAKENDCYTINVVNGDLTIENGTFVGNISVVQVQKGSLTINGGAFSLLQKMTDGKGENRYLINCIDSEFTSGNANVAISGGTFVGFDPNVSPEQEVDGKAPSFAAPGAGITKNEDGSFTAAAGMTAQILDKDGNSVKAYESLTEAVAAAEDGQTVTLLADATEDVVISKSITLDLGGKTLTNTNAGKATISVTSGTVTVKNGNVVGGTSYYNIEAKKDANLTLTDVTATAGNNGSSMIDNYGTLTITSGTYTGGLDTVKNEPSAKLNITGGTFTLTKGNSDGFTGVVFNYGELTISGGEFIQSDKSAPYGQAQVIHTDKSGSAAPSTVITGGTFKNLCTAKTTAWVVREMNAAAGATKVSGGAFNKEVKDYYCADGFIPTKNADGTYGVKVGKYVAEIGNKKYETLADAIRLAAKGRTITLLCDVEQNTQLSINKSITLDLNGKTIKISGYTAERAQVSVKGNLTIQDSSEAQTGKICSDYTGTAGRVVSVENGGKLTIAGGTITTEGMSGPSGSAVYIASGAEVSMTGGTVKVDAKRGNVAMNVKGSTGVFIMSGGSVIAEAGDGTETNITAISGSSGSTIQISAGTVSGPQALFARSSATTITGGNFTGSITVKNGSISGGTFDRALDKNACAAGYVPADNGDGTYGVAVGKFTVKVTSRTTASDSPVANVAGGGSDITYAEGITVTASAISGYTFVGWFVNEYTGTAYNTNLTCEVKPTDDWTMIAVYEPISGGKFWLTVTASEFTVNGGAVQDSYLYEQFAVGASVTVNFTGTENFLYWVNASNKVVSTDKSYTFIMGSETTLKAVYGKARQNQATVVFISHSDQIISSKAYTTSDTIQFPVPPIKMGCTFTGWSMTEEQIRAAMANNSGIIQVRALYTEPSIACKVTVIYPDGIGNEVVNAVVGKAVNVTAKDIEGKTFSYWTDNAGNILGYTKTLKLAPSGDMTVKAVYDQAAEAKPVITMSEVSATTANESYVVTFMATRAVPNGYKVVKQGILWSRDAVCGEDGAAAYMQFDSNGKLPDGVRAYIGNNLELNGVTRYDITTKYNDRTFYGRGYMVLESDAGEILYIYTDTIASGSYDSLTK